MPGAAFAPQGLEAIANVAGQPASSTVKPSSRLESVSPSLIDDEDVRN
jgi:hypothetical protein